MGELANCTEKQRALVENLFTDQCQGDPHKAMKAAGYAPSTKFDQVLTEDMRKIILSMAQQYLVENSGKAVFKLVDVLDNPSEIGTDKIIQASKEILDRVGVVKVEKHRHEIGAEGVIILPIKDIPLDKSAITIDAKKLD